MVLLLIIAIAVIAFVALIIKSSDVQTLSPEKVAGKRGEAAAANIIRSVLRKGDLLLTNVEIDCDGKKTELDNVIVNKNGVFIIEVKNYSGSLVGCESDFEWYKYHTSRGGNVYVKTVKNPIRQVKRQIYILAHYLEYFGIDVYVCGYAIFLNDNCPVSSPYVLSGINDIEVAIHSARKQRLDAKTIRYINGILS